MEVSLTINSPPCAFSKVAKEKGIAMVIQSNPNAQIVLYAQADSEITAEVVKAFDKEK